MYDSILCGQLRHSDTLELSRFAAIFAIYPRNRFSDSTFASETESFPTVTEQSWERIKFPTRVRGTLKNGLELIVDAIYNSMYRTSGRHYHFAIYS